MNFQAVTGLLWSVVFLVLIVVVVFVVVCVTAPIRTMTELVTHPKDFFSGTFALALGPFDLPSNRDDTKLM